MHPFVPKKLGHKLALWTVSLVVFWVAASVAEPNHVNGRNGVNAQFLEWRDLASRPDLPHPFVSAGQGPGAFEHNTRLLGLALGSIHSTNIPFTAQQNFFGPFLQDIPGINAVNPNAPVGEPVRSLIEEKLIADFLQTSIANSPTADLSLDSLALFEFAKIRASFLAGRSNLAPPPVAPVSPFYEKAIPIILNALPNIRENPKLLGVFQKLAVNPANTAEVFNKLRRLSNEELALLRLALPKLIKSFPVDKAEARKAASYLLAIVDSAPLMGHSLSASLRVQDQVHKLAKAFVHSAPESYFAKELELVDKATPAVQADIKRLTELYPALHSFSYEQLYTIHPAYVSSLVRLLESNYDEAEAHSLARDMSKPKALIDYLRKKHQEKYFRISEARILQILGPLVGQENLEKFLGNKTDVKARGTMIDNLRRKEQLLLQKNNPTESDKGLIAAHELALELLKEDSVPYRANNEGPEHYLNSGIEVDLEKDDTTLTIHDYADFVVAVSKLLDQVMDLQKRGKPIKFPKIEMHKVSPADLAKMNDLMNNLRKIRNKSEGYQAVVLPGNLLFAKHSTHQTEFANAFDVVDQRMKEANLHDQPGRYASLTVLNPIDSGDPQSWAGNLRASELEAKEWLKKLFRSQIPISEIMSDPKLNALVRHFLGKSAAEHFGWAGKAGTTLVTEDERKQLINLVYRGLKQHYMDGLSPLGPNKKAPLNDLQKAQYLKFFEATPLDTTYLLSHALGGNQGYSHSLFMRKVLSTLMPGKNNDPYLFARRFGPTFGEIPPSNTVNGQPYWYDYGNAGPQAEIFDDFFATHYPYGVDGKHFYASPERMAPILLDPKLTDEQKATEYVVRLLKDFDKIAPPQAAQLKKLPPPILLALAASSFLIEEKVLQSIYANPSIPNILHALFTSGIPARVKDAIALEILGDLKKQTIVFSDIDTMENTLEQLILFEDKPLPREQARKALVKRLIDLGTDFLKDEKGERIALAYLIGKLSGDDQLPAAILRHANEPASPLSANLAQLKTEVTLTQRAYDKAPLRVAGISHVIGKLGKSQGLFDSRFRIALLEMDLKALKIDETNPSNYQNYLSYVEPFFVNFAYLFKHAPADKFAEARALMGKGDNVKEWLVLIGSLAATYHNYGPYHTANPQLLPFILEANIQMAERMIKRLKEQKFTNADLVRMFDGDKYHATRSGLTLKEYWKSQGIEVDAAFLASPASPEIIQRLIAFLTQDITVGEMHVKYAHQEKTRDFFINHPLLKEKWNTGANFRKAVEDAYLKGHISDTERAGLLALPISSDLNPFSSPDARKLVHRLIPPKSEVPRPIVGELDLPHPETPTLAPGLPMPQRLLLSANRSYDATYFVIHGSEEFDLDPKKKAEYIKLREQQLAEEIRVLDLQIGHVAPTQKNLPPEKRDLIEALAVKKKELALLGQNQNEARCAKDLPPSPVKTVTVRAHLNPLKNSSFPKPEERVPTDIMFDIPVEWFDGTNTEPLWEKMVAAYLADPNRVGMVRSIVRPHERGWAYEPFSISEFLVNHKFPAEWDANQQQRFLADRLLNQAAGLKKAESRVAALSSDKIRRKSTDNVNFAKQLLDQIFHFERSDRRAKLDSEKNLHPALKHDENSLGGFHTLFFPGAGLGLDALLPKWCEDIYLGRQDVANREMYDFVKKNPKNGSYLMSVIQFLPARHPLKKAAWRAIYPPIYQPLFDNPEFAERFRRAPQQLCSVLWTAAMSRQPGAPTDAVTLMADVRREGDKLLAERDAGYQTGVVSQDEKKVVRTMPLASTNLAGAASERIYHLATASTVTDSFERYGREPAYLSIAGPTADHKRVHFTTDMDQAQDRVTEILKLIDYYEYALKMPKEKWEAKQKLESLLRSVIHKDFDPKKFKEVRPKIMAALDELTQLQKFDSALHWNTDKREQEKVIEFIRASFFQVDKAFDNPNSTLADRSKFINEYLKDLGKWFHFPDPEKKLVPDHPGLQTEIINVMWQRLGGDRKEIAALFDKGIPVGLDRIRSAAKKTQDELETHMTSKLGNVVRPEFKKGECEDLKPPPRQLNETIVKNLQKFLVECQDSAARSAGNPADWSLHLWSAADHRGYWKKQKSTIRYVPLTDTAGVTFGGLTDKDLGTLRELSPASLAALNYLVGSQINWAVPNGSGIRPICEVLDRKDANSRGHYQWPNTISANQVWNETVFHVPTPKIEPNEAQIIDDFIDRKIPVVTRTTPDGKPYHGPRDPSVPFKETFKLLGWEEFNKKKGYGKFESVYDAPTYNPTPSHSDYSKADLVSVIKQPNSTNIYRRIFGNTANPQRGKQFLEFFGQSFPLTPDETAKLQSIVSSVPGVKDWKELATKMLTVEGPELIGLQKAILPKVQKLLTEHQGGNLGEYLTLIANLPQDVRGPQRDFDCLTRLRSIRNQDPKTLAESLKDLKLD